MRTKRITSIGILITLLCAPGSFVFAQVLPEDPSRGGQVFIIKGCVKCHALNGVGGKVGPDLGKIAKTFYISLPQIASTMWNKGPTLLVRMAQIQFGINNFTSKEMVDLLAYLYFLRFIDEPGNTANGKRLFSEMGCSQCHGLDGKRGKLMYIDLTKYQNQPSTEIVASMWNHSAQIQKAVGEAGFPWPQFKKGEMGDLLEFIRNPEKR